MTLLLAALAFLAQEDSERLQRLEAEVRAQQAEIDRLKPEWGVDLTDGVRWRTHDGSFEFHAGGRFEEELRAVSGSPGGPRTSPDTFFVREAFLTLEGTLYREFGFVVNGDFATPAGLEEAYLEWKRVRELTLRFGQFRTPNSQEALTPGLYTDCIERSVLSRFVPEVQLGIEAEGELEGGLVSYQVAVINGRSDPSNPDRASAPTGGEKDVLARITWSPFVEGSDYLRHLRLGVYGSMGGSSEVPMASLYELETTELGIVVLDSTAGLLHGRRWRAGIELSYVIGPASLRGEVLWRRDGIRDAADTVEESLPVRAWYGQLTVILFGSEKVVEAGLTPAQPFEPSEGHWGALEAAVRLAGARVGAAPWEAVGNTLAGQSNRVVTFTSGLNWYPVRNVRISADWIFEGYRQDVDFGNGVVRRGLQGLLARFQVEF
ncbi:MAG TPA: porin [Planctomycetota bacterium]|nr:porin [Planctomycetota bacterium]